MNTIGTSPSTITGSVAGTASPVTKSETEQNQAITDGFTKSEAGIEQNQTMPDTLTKSGAGKAQSKADVENAAKPEAKEFSPLTELIIGVSGTLGIIAACFATCAAVTSGMLPALPVAGVLLGVMGLGGYSIANSIAHPSPEDIAEADDEAEFLEEVNRIRSDWE